MTKHLLRFLLGNVLSIPEVPQERQHGSQGNVGKSQKGIKIVSLSGERRGRWGGERRGGGNSLGSRLKGESFLACSLVLFRIWDLLCESPAGSSDFRVGEMGLAKQT